MFALPKPNTTIDNATARPTAGLPCLPKGPGPKLWHINQSEVIVEHTELMNKV